MADSRHIVWEQPPVFTCNGCGDKAPGHIEDALRGRPAVLPAGWIRGFDDNDPTESILYVCSGACGNAVMMGPRGEGGANG